MTTVWRKFDSEQQFTEWHDQVKVLLGMPIVGIRASDGVPQPTKQQTTDYTALTYRDLEVDSDGEPIIPETPLLDAVVAQPSIFEMVSTLVREDMMTAQEIAEMASMFDPWQPGETLQVDDLRAYDGMLWRVVQGHTTQADWTPDIARSLFVRTVAQDVIPEWVQPLGSHDAWPLGAVVTYNGLLYESQVAANVGMPGSDPSLWSLVEEEPGPGEEWVDTGRTIIQLVASGVYRCSGVPTIALNQAIRLGDTSAGETVFTGYWPTTGTPSDYITIAPHKAVANGVKVWKWA
jgi:hypothetical protein